MEALQKVTRVIGKKFDINVVFKGAKAYTDGKSVVLPALPETLSDDDIKKTRGYCDHETTHIRYTDFDLMKAMIGGDRKLHTVWNYLEDIRNEALHTKEYPGAKLNIEYLVQEVLKEVPVDNILMKIFVEGRRRLCGYRLDQPDFTKEITDIFGADFFERLAALKDTKEAIQMAQDMIDAYESMKPEDMGPPPNESKSSKPRDKGEPSDGKPKPRTTPEPDDDDAEPADPPDPFGDNDDQDETPGDGKAGDSKGNEKDDAGDDAGGNTGDGEDKDEKAGDGKAGSGKSDGDARDGSASKDGEKGDGKGREGADEADDETGDDEEASQGGGTEKTDGRCSGGKARKAIDDCPEDAFAVAKKTIESLHDEAVTTEKYMVLDKSGDELRVVAEADNLRRFERIKTELGSLNAIRGKVASLFLARTQSRWINDREEGKVNTRALAKLKTGNHRVFRERFVSKDRDTAISFLVDFSGSMSGYEIDNAMRAVVMFLETLEGSKIKSEVLGYTTNDNAFDDWGDVRDDEALSTYGRIEKLLTLVFKTFDEPYTRKVKARISNYKTVQMANNCDPENVEIAYRRLVVRPEHRKILFVLTDGLVANRGNCEVGRKYMKDLCRDIDKQGKVELIGVGVGESRVKDYFPRHLFIRSGAAPTELATSLFSELKKILKV